MHVTVVCDNCNSCAFKDFVIKDISFVNHEGKQVTKLKMECKNCRVPYTVVIKKDHDQPVGAGRNIDMETEKMMSDQSVSIPRTNGNFTTRYSDRNQDR